jgi:hypothetical protein
MGTPLDLHCRIRVRATAGSTIAIPSWLRIVSRSASPDTMRSARMAIAVASTSSSAGSRLTRLGSGGASAISTRRCNSRSSLAASVLERSRTARSLRRRITKSNSLTSAGEVTIVNQPARALSSNSCGGPRQSRPEIRTLVSRTTRTALASCANGLHLGIDFLHRQRRDAGFPNPVGNRHEPTCRPSPPDGLAHQSGKCTRRQQARFTRSLDGRIR